MKLQDDLLTLFTAQITDHDGTPVIPVPERELELGDLAAGETYRIAILPSPESSAEPASSKSRETPRHTATTSAPPVSEGDQLDVEIEDVGEQGDGVARVEPGYVIFVPETDLGDRVTIEITETRENFGFAEVITPESIVG